MPASPACQVSIQSPPPLLNRAVCILHELAIETALKGFMCCATSRGCASVVECLLFSNGMTAGEDLEKVGGAAAENSFMTLSDTSSCGKMTALAKLLDLWYTQQNANKVVICLLPHCSPACTHLYGAGPPTCPQLEHPPAHSLTHSLTRSLTALSHLSPLLACLLNPSLTPSLPLSLAPSLPHSLAHSPTVSPAHMIARSLPHSLPHSLIHPPTHSPTHPPTRSLTRSHPFTRSLTSPSHLPPAACKSALVDAAAERLQPPSVHGLHRQSKWENPKWDKTLLSSQVLVFSHSVRMLDIIERLVIMAGYVYLRLDGSTKQQDRQSKVDQFNTSASVFLFLISTTAGGLGLNLTAANRSAPTRRRRRRI